MEYQKFNQHLVVRIDANESIIESLMRVARAEKISLASINGIGAVKSFTVGFFNPKTKVYQEQTFKGYYEITSLIGNITTHNGEPYFHLHANFGNDNYQIVGGHLKEAIISVTCEIVIMLLEGNVGRKMGEVGINILNFTASKE